MTSRTRDILVVASWFPSIVDPVAGRFVADQVMALQAAGCRIRVISFDPADLIGSGGLRARMAGHVERVASSAFGAGLPAFSLRGSESQPGLPVARLPIPNGRTARDPILHALRYRQAALTELGVDLVSGGAPDTDAPFRPVLIHAHTGYPDGSAAAILADALAVPLVITEHATFLDRLFAVPAIRSAYVDGARRASAVVAVSQTFAIELSASLPEIADRIRVVANAVDVDSFRVAAPGERRPGELLFVGYWKEIKGIDVLLRALALIRSRRPAATLRLVGQAGDPALDRRWRALAAEVGVTHAVAFDPPMDRSGVAAAMRRADVFVHASRRETFGVVAAEALASGLPVVATDSGGVTEILGDQVADLGAIVARDNPEAFATEVLRVLDRRSAYDQDRLRATIVERYGGAAVAAKLLDLYDRTIADWAGRPSSAAGQMAPQPATGGRSPVRRIAPQPNGRRIIVVAFDPERARILARLPAAARARIVLVTSSQGVAAELTVLAAIIVADLHDRVRALEDARRIGPRARGWRRILAALRHPMATARRRGLLPGLESLVTGRGTAAVRDGVRAAIGDAGGEPPMIVCGDGVDYLAALPVIDAGLGRAAPGGIRWLADQLADS